MGNLDYFKSVFNPTSVAIVGISRKRPSLGQMILDNLNQSGFRGEIYLVNPKSSEINGYKCYTSLSTIIMDVELVIILVPAKFILSVLEDAGKKDVIVAILITAGFSEVSKEGQEIEKQMLEIAKKYNIRLIGPNSMGSYSHNTHVSFSPIPIIKGDVSYLSQSGSILVVAMEQMLPFKIGFSKFISLGNKIDINISHALQYLEGDQSTKIVNAYLESFSDPMNFREMATKLTKSKPFILVKGGRTEAGARAASSHTGALAGEDRLIAAIIESSGVIQASTIDEQVELTRFFKKYQRISNTGVAIVSSAGGPAILASDEIVNNGLRLSKFSEKTIVALSSIIPPEGSIINPVDILAAANEEIHVKTIEVLQKDPDVSAIIVLIVHPVLITTENLLQELSVCQNSQIPIICCYFGPSAIKYQEMTDLIVTSSSKTAVRMIKAGQFYSDWINNFDKYTDFSHLVGLTPDTGEVKLLDMLKTHGFNVPEMLITMELEDLKAFLLNHSSVVMKINHPIFSHKSDVGGVFLGITTEKELIEVWESIQVIYRKHSINKSERMVEIQEFIGYGIEVALGIIYDQMFGHFVMIGSGGTNIELYGDVKFEPLPISRKTARKMIVGLKLKTLLNGFRGGIKVDEGKIIDMILQLNRMIVQYPTIKELDLNPVIIENKSGNIVVVDSRIKYINEN